MKFLIPKHVKDILEKLEESGFEAFLVGGCVRDLLMGREPKDWDITTNAKPEEVQKLFPDSVYENKFGTVGVKIRGELATDVVEVTTYRKEEAYTDKRHPDKVEFTSKLEDDLSRRDFTINAIAARIKNYESRIKEEKNSLFIIPDSLFGVVDPFNGQDDIKKKLIRAVGEASERFNEDALRLMRAVRFSAQLEFSIEEKTQQAIKEKAQILKMVSRERVRDELIKMVASPGAEQGIRALQELELLRHVIPELEEGIGVEQNLHHKYTVYEHNVRSLGYAAKFEYTLTSRFASLLHDIGKPKTKRGKGETATFYGHDVVGARMAAKILDRLRFPKKLAEKIVTLIRYHMFYYDVGEVTARSVRRLLVKVGPENIDELLETRIAERKGSGVPKAEPYRLRHLRYMIDKVSRDPLSVGMLKIRGEDVMRQLKLEPGPKIGLILNALLEEVIDNPKLNTKKNLELRIKNLGELPEKELKKLADAGKGKLGEAEDEIDKKIKGKYYVK